MTKKKPKDLVKLEFDPSTTNWDQFTSHCVKTYDLGDVNEFRGMLRPWFADPANQTFPGFDDDFWEPSAEETTRMLIRGRRGGPLAQVISVVENEDNWGTLAEILEKGDDLPHLYDLGRALDRIHWILTRRSKKGRKPKDPFLRSFVGDLAAYWRAKTGKPFKQDWHEQDGYSFPVTQDKSAEFVYTVIYYFNPGFIPGLRKVMQHAVAKQRATSRK